MLCSEKDWIKKRRLEVASKMSQGASSSRMHVNPDDYWTDTHEREVNFNRRKQNNELMRAYEGGVLLDREVDIDAKSQFRSKEPRLILLECSRVNHTKRGH